MMLALLMLTLLTGGVPLQEVPARSVESLIQEAQRLVGERNFPQAALLVAECKQLAPGDARPYFLAGLIQEASGNLGGSIPELERAVELDPNTGEYSLVLGEALLRSGDRTRAATALEKFKDPTLVEGLVLRQRFILSDLLVRLGDVSQARAVLETPGLTTENEEPRVQARIGRLAVQQGNLDDALAAFQKVVEKSEDKAPGYFGVARVLSLKNDYEAARDAILEAVSLAPRNPEYVIELAAIALALKQPDVALPYLQGIEDLAERFPRIHDSLAMVYEAMGQSEQSGVHREKFQQLDAQRRNARERAEQTQSLLQGGQQALVQGRTGQARQAFQSVLQLDSDNWAAHVSMARIELSDRALSQAYPHILKMREINPEALESQFLMARYWFEGGDVVRARAEAENARSAFPADAELRNLLGNIYLAMSEVDLAIQEYEEAVRLAPNRQDFRLNLEVAQRNRKP